MENEMGCPNCGEQSRISTEHNFCYRCGYDFRTGTTGRHADVSLLRSGNIYTLDVHRTGFIHISDYKIQSSADGETELCVTFKGVPYVLDLKASLIQ